MALVCFPQRPAPKQDRSIDCFSTVDHHTYHPGSKRRKLQEQRFFAVVFARHRRSSGRFSAADGGLCGGFPPGGEVTREVTEVSWLSHACGCERRAHCEFNRHCQSAYAFLNLKARGPVRGWVLFGGYLGGRSETTSDSDRERFLSYVMTQKKTITSNLSPLHGGGHSARGGGHSEVFCGEGRRFFRRRVERGARSGVLST